MNLRSLIRQWVPEGFVRLARTILNHTGRAEWKVLDGGWDAPGKDPRGWDVEDVVQQQTRKWEHFQRTVADKGPLGINHEAPGGSSRTDLFAHNLLMSYAYVLATAARNKKRVRILDWGGGLGHYYLVSKSLLGPDIELDYTCFDVPRLCEAGRHVLPEVRFSSDRDEVLAGRYDLVHAGSSLWYDRDWASTASRLMDSTDDLLYFARMLFVQQNDAFVVKQRPYGTYRTEYIAWVLNSASFVDYLHAHGGILVREFYYGSGPLIHRALEQADFRGFLFSAPERRPFASTNE